MPTYQGNIPRPHPLASAARAAEGIPAPSAVPGAAAQTVPDLLAQIKAGQVSAEVIIALLSLLAGQGMGGLPQGPGAPEAEGIEAAFLGG